MTAPAICVPQYSLSTTDALRMSIQVCSTARECCAGGHDHETCLGRGTARAHVVIVTQAWGCAKRLGLQRVAFFRLVKIQRQE